MIYDADVLIIGGGLAGLTAAIHLAKSELRVILLEKYTYPQHKVCGEYVSNEVLPYLQHLGIDIDELSPARIHRFLLSTATGKTVESKLPLGGFGVSRHALDHFLANTARRAGVVLEQQTEVTDVTFANDAFTVTTSAKKNYTATIVIGAYGKRSQLDKRLQRPFFQQESLWLGIKAHYRATLPNDQVALHNFEGGYCGLSQVENGIINACYLANYRSFKSFKHIDAFQKQVLSKNPFLRDFFTEATPLFDKPLTISQISFSRKQPIENHVLMCGDTAGLIHPLCGNGMAMAIHSAKLASELIVRFFEGELPNRLSLETQYAAAWSAEFKGRLLTGRIVQSILTSPGVTSALLTGLQLAPGLLPLIIKQTHGQPLLVNQKPVSASNSL
ncbi:NAD(P)/FAD-dependent oxidoreductase [Spirosoma radiotolerans]|uniref:FAD-dependent oxidoreductase n=1 Tax=Spirosoma radiotolerans TaxID=1379870 RepID=A0A0E3ZW35_9BACT|nr:NAD(P)/FAD-dependent oxidoreductase [Spirosoma radiotolerans]AKD56380.1 FAD-dependent oxidoreductase [Spirosoma radiotolerans]